MRIAAPDSQPHLSIVSGWDGVDTRSVKNRMSWPIKGLRRRRRPRRRTKTSMVTSSSDDAADDADDD
eukprot:7290566-Pyramimonas_sp.AAC.1